MNTMLKGLAVAENIEAIALRTDREMLKPLVYGTPDLTAIQRAELLASARRTVRAVYCWCEAEPLEQGPEVIHETACFDVLTALFHPLPVPSSHVRTLKLQGLEVHDGEVFIDGRKLAGRVENFVEPVSGDVDDFAERLRYYRENATRCVMLPVVGECYRCGDQAVDEGELGEPCAKDRCTGKYIAVKA